MIPDINTRPPQAHTHKHTKRNCCKLGTVIPVLKMQWQKNCHKFEISSVSTVKFCPKPRKRQEGWDGRGEKEGSRERIRREKERRKGRNRKKKGREGGREGRGRERHKKRMEEA